MLSAVAGAALLALVIGAGWLLLRPRPRLAATLPDNWRQQLPLLIPQMSAVPEALRERYFTQVETFLRRKRFIGCDGLAVSDEMRLAIAGLACLLILRDDAEVFPAIDSVLVYPGAFLVHHQEPDELGLVDDAPVEQIGESWQGDRVLLSWTDVQAALSGDPVNVVAHEFAHQLDDEAPHTEGAPRLTDYTRWAAVMQREYERLQRHRRPLVLDPYGAESPGEFFGVVTEAFLQRPFEMRQHHAELYALLADYYRLDPARAPPTWPPAWPPPDLQSRSGSV